MQQENKLVIGHTEVFGVLERPQIIFDHGRHVKELKKEGCGVCHPANADKNLVFQYPFSVQPGDEAAVRDAYHSLCIVCHTKRLREKEKYGPITCGECHDRKRAREVPSIPVFVFDFHYHEKHVQKLGKRCDLCHHSYDTVDRELVYEAGTEQSCYYCHDLDAKRGPFLKSEIEVAKQKRLTMRKVSHDLCVNCHLSFSRQNVKAGPLECAECHTGKYRTVSELRNAARPDRNQPQKPLIRVEGGMMKGVSFDHKSHQENSLTCKECHHETLNSCKTCHTLTGSADGKWITTANAYHHPFSEAACTGCHAKIKARNNCAGCHHRLRDMDTQTKGPKKEFCSVCHSGSEKVPVQREQIQSPHLIGGQVPDKVTIKVLENEYRPSTFPHLKIIEKLIDTTNDSRLASTFHKNIDSICQGCHHQSLPKAEAEKRKPPYCRNCHSIGFDAQNINRPRLLAAYHRQCIGCHNKMNIDAKDCRDCHEDKPEGKVHARDILREK